jgi:hypothetical protein
LLFKKKKEFESFFISKYYLNYYSNILWDQFQICLDLRYFKCLLTCDEVIFKFGHILINVNTIFCGIQSGCISK